jgi:pimeloyl-ACP methyl ester carboxylesterase
VTDLVLVIHGIGQKFAERVESFHFTHAINAFRRAVNFELGREPVKSLLRPGQHGVMILPVNWRHTVSFDDAAAGTTAPGKMSQEETSDRVDGGTGSDTRYPRFSLKDIEPHTIPAVRGIISDVMFDIPFYLSHHKPKMIAGLVGEANRVYRLWCSNNPEFPRKGRVHLIGHSLGSAMALDVLSRQPTRLPPVPGPAPPLEVPHSAAALALKHFDFDTTNLFLLGSPAGFFLLLERGRLLPRRGRGKAGADTGEYMADNVVGEAGQFGCLAVDNIYNVLAREDPIAYLLNGTIDPAYAATLKAAYVPSTATSLLTSMGNALRTMTGAAPAPTASTTASLTAPPPPPKPPTLRLPSQLEMEVHDFTREELAERKAYLLNDNGQIDFYLRSTGGPLEIQYLNMLSAHTSYWTNQDLIRMLCVEVGRKPGRANTLPSMRAVKKRDVSSLLRS